MIRKNLYFEKCHTYMNRPRSHHLQQQSSSSFLLLLWFVVQVIIISNLVLVVLLLPYDVVSSSLSSSIDDINSNNVEDDIIDLDQFDNNNNNKNDDDNDNNNNNRNIEQNIHKMNIIDQDLIIDTDTIQSNDDYDDNDINILQQQNQQKNILENLIHKNEENNENYYNDDGIIQRFYSIEDIYKTLQQQQEQDQHQSIYWMILIYNEQCTMTHKHNNMDITTIYRNAAKLIQGWNHEFHNNIKNNNNSNINNNSWSTIIPYIHIGQYILQNSNNIDKEFIITQLGITTTPSIVLINIDTINNTYTTSTTTTTTTLDTSTHTNNNDDDDKDGSNTNNNSSSIVQYGPIYIVEYTSTLSDANIMAVNIRHYFDTISSLRSQPTDSHIQSTTTTMQYSNQNPLQLIQPRQFKSIYELQNFIILYTKRLFWIQSESNTYLSKMQHLVLSKEKLSIEERYYIEWLFDNNDHNNNNITSSSSIYTNHDNNIDHTSYTYNDDEFVLLIIQCRIIDNINNHSNANTQNSYYTDFNKMAQTVQARRDLIFYIIEQQSHNNDWCTVDGSVHVFEIPNSVIHYDHTINVLSLPPKEWMKQFVYYKYDPPQKHTNKTNIQLHEFLIIVCTNNILWFDRQLIAPIAFPKYRKVHAVLVVDMHYDIMSFVSESYQTYIEQQSELVDNNYNNHIPNSAMLISDHLHTLLNKRAVTDFRQACRNHRLKYTKELIVEYDMVCLVIPSTETRILTTFGMIELWTQIDHNVDQYTADKFVQDQQNNTSYGLTKMTIPRLLITDQRYGGTRRYYKDLITSYHDYENIESNSDSMETIDNPIDDYFTKFWMNELQYEIKSGVTPHKDTNKYGVHLLTANTIPTKLFNNMEQQSQSAQHALVLFTTSTCGHCKRIWTIWNRLSHVLQNIKWDTFLQLYHIDVSQNDIAATPLNVTVEWIPEVYYLSPDRTKRIRYNITDELGDGIGGIREPYEIIHWLINDVGNNFMDEDRIKQLLFDLEQLGNESKG